MIAPGIIAASAAFLRETGRKIVALTIDDESHSRLRSELVAKMVARTSEPPRAPGYYMNAPITVGGIRVFRDGQTIENEHQLHPEIVDAAIALLRTTYRNDGADGESIHLVCDAVLKLRRDLAMAKLEADALAAGLGDAVKENLDRALAAEAKVESSRAHARTILQRLERVDAILAEMPATDAAIIQSWARRWKMLAKALFADEIHYRVDHLNGQRSRVAVSRSAITARERDEAREALEALSGAHCPGCEAPGCKGAAAEARS